MLEYELRFRLEHDLSYKLIDLGFRKKDEFRMADLIFEPRSWRPGDMIDPGYHVVRIRLAEGKKPRLELKEFSHAHAWHETHFHIDGPAHFVKLLSKIMVPRRILEKRRETWSNGPIKICVDDVRHLGRFIEIEGSELEVKEMAIALGFRLEDHQANYGSQLFYLEKTGFISFHQEDMEAVLKEFS